MKVYHSRSTFICECFQICEKIDEIFSKKIFKILKIVFIPLEKTVNDPIGRLKRAKIANLNQFWFFDEYGQSQVSFLN